MDKEYFTKLVKRIGLPLCLFALGSVNASAIQCPVLTAAQVRSSIETGNVVNSSETLLDEIGRITAAKVREEEPTANPFDTYHQIFSHITFNHKFYLVEIGNVLASSIPEVRARVKKILLGNSDVFFAEKIESGICIYREIDASKRISGYPFKSRYETVQLMVVGI